MSEVFMNLCLKIDELVKGKENRAVVVTLDKQKEEYK